MRWPDGGSDARSAPGLRGASRRAARVAALGRARRRGSRRSIAREGTGELAAHRVLRLADHGLVGVLRPDPISLADLEGGEAQQAPLARRSRGVRRRAMAPTTRCCTDRRARGSRPRCAGWRRSSPIAVSASSRSIEARSRGSASVFSLLPGEGPHCLVYLDDLAFDDGGRTDRVLRAALEGGVVERPGERARVGHVEPAAPDARDARRAGRRYRGPPRGGREDGARDALRPARRVPVALAGRLPRDLQATRARAARHRCPRSTDEAALRFAAAGHGMTQRTARQFAGAFRP